MEEHTIDDESSKKNPPAPESSQKIPPDSSESSQKNPPQSSQKIQPKSPESALENPNSVIDEASPRSLIPVSEVSQENPLESSESSQKNPPEDLEKTPIESPQSAEGNPYSAIDKASPGSLTPMSQVSQNTLPESAEKYPPDEYSDSAQENPSSAMDEASPGSSIPISEGSQENPPNYCFRFEVKPAKRLKLAVEALCDPEFNPTGRGKIYVHYRGFFITTRSPSNVVGILWLLPSGIHNFQCRVPVFGDKLVDLRQISAHLVADDQDTVTVSQIEGSNHITFLFGGERTQEFTAEFYVDDGEIWGGFPIGWFCETTLPSRDMDLLVDRMIQDGRPQLVSISVKQQNVIVGIGNERVWRLKYSSDNMVVALQGYAFTMGAWGQWQRHIALFYWTHPEVLRKAALLYPFFFVSFCELPQDMVFFCFSLQHQGSLSFIAEATQVMPNYPMKRNR